MKVLVVDDSLFIRERVVEMLVEISVVGIVGLAIDVQSAQDAVIEARPDIVILDIGLPGTPQIHNGIDLLGWIRVTLPQAHVVMLTNLSDDAYRRAAAQLGAYAFLDKTREYEQLPGIIRKLADLVQHEL